MNEIPTPKNATYRVEVYKKTQPGEDPGEPYIEYFNNPDEAAKCFANFTDYGSECLMYWNRTDSLLDEWRILGMIDNAAMNMEAAALRLRNFASNYKPNTTCPEARLHSIGSN